MAKLRTTGLVGALLAGLVLPGVLLAAWAVIELGGVVEGLHQDERRRASELLGEARQAFARQLAAAARDDASVLVVRLDGRGRVVAPFLPDVIDRRLPASEPEDALVEVAMRCALRGDPAQARHCFEIAARGSARLPAEALLAFARSLAATGEVAEARDLLARAVADRPAEAIEGLPVALLAGLLDARLAVAASDSAPARLLRQRLVTGQQALPVAAVRPVLAELDALLGDRDPQAEALVHAADVCRDLEAGALVVGDEAPRPARGGIAWPTEKGALRLLSPASVATALAAAVRSVASEAGDLRLVTAPTPELALAEAPFDLAGLRVRAVAAGTLPSEQLARLGRTLLVLAAIAFLLGNLAMFAAARREVALSRLRGEFVDLVSHELRTPLAALSLKSEMLASGDVPAGKERAYARSLHAEVGRLSALVHRILDFARLERRRAPMLDSHVPARRLLALAVRDGRSALQLRGHRLEIEAARDLPELCADADMLARALRNLLENAAKYSPPGSTITLSAACARGSLTIEVADRGPGVPRAQRARIFEPFVRGAKTGEGSGLGLALVDRAARAHRGRVTIGDRQGGGAVFTLRIPVLGRKVS
jgi:signal transduction histidine kinase